MTSKVICLLSWVLAEQMVLTPSPWWLLEKHCCHIFDNPPILTMQRQSNTTTPLAYSHHHYHQSLLFWPSCTVFGSDPEATVEAQGLQQSHSTNAFPPTQPP